MLGTNSRLRKDPSAVILFYDSPIYIQYHNTNITQTGREVKKGHEQRIKRMGPLWYMFCARLWRRGGPRRVALGSSGDGGGTQAGQRVGTLLAKANDVPRGTTPASRNGSELARFLQKANDVPRDAGCG